MTYAFRNLNTALSLNPSILEQELQTLIRKALDEDLNNHIDVTSHAIIAADAKGTAQIKAKQSGVLSGLAAAYAVFDHCGEKVSATFHKQDGDTVEKGEIIANAEGNLRDLLLAERTALNFIGHLSGVASLTARYVDAVKGTGAQIMATRKTLPGLRSLQKQAVIDGGGDPHRYGLYDAILVKDNHLAAMDNDIKATMEKVTEFNSNNLQVILELETLDQIETLLSLSAELHPDRVLLDNMSLETMKKAVKMIGKALETEASGGITLENIYEYAQTGVNAISCGAITHSAIMLDVSMEITQ